MRLFEACTNLQNIYFAENSNLSRIGMYAFLDCCHLKEIIFPSRLKLIDFAAFRGCKNIKRIIIPASVTHIDAYAFEGCHNLEEIVFEQPSQLKTIDDHTFANCKILKSIVIRAYLRHISNNVFSGCGDLKRIYVTHSIVQKIKDMLGSDFESKVCGDYSQEVVGQCTILILLVGSKCLMGLPSDCIASIILHLNLELPHQLHELMVVLTHALLDHADMDRIKNKIENAIERSECKWSVGRAAFKDVLGFH